MIGVSTTIASIRATRSSPANAPRAAHVGHREPSPVNTQGPRMFYLSTDGADHDVGGMNVKYIRERRTAPDAKLPPAAVRTIVVAL